MAEDLDIQSLWKRSMEKEDPASLHINTLKKKGTKTTLYWVKFILWIEFWLSVVGLPLMIYYQQNRNDPEWFVAFYVVLTIGYLFYYQFLIRAINRFSYDGNVIQSLKKVYGYLRFYILHYKVVIWISVIVGLIYGFLAEENREAMEKLTTAKHWLIAIGISSLIMGAIGGIMHWLIHLIYGRKIKRLRKMVKDLESEE